MSDVVSARVETVAPGDRVFTPRGVVEGFLVDELAGPYDDDTFVVVYWRRSISWQNRAGDAGDKMRASEIGWQRVSLAPIVRGERIVVRRADPADGPVLRDLQGRFPEWDAVLQRASFAESRKGSS